MIGYAFEHRLDDTWILRQTLRYAYIDARFEGAAIDSPAPFGARSSLLNRSASWSREAVDGVSLDNQAQARVETRPIAHTLLLGLGYQGAWAKTAMSGYGPVPEIDFTAPVYGRQDDQAFTNRVGAVYLFDSGLAPYASYATSFEPMLGAGFSGAPFKPTHARQAEAGVKFQPPGLDSFVAVSAFDITQGNVATADPAHPFFTVQTRAVRSRGIELEARATLPETLDLIGAYTDLDTRVRRDSNPARVALGAVPVPGRSTRRFQRRGRDPPCRSQRR